MNPLDQLADIQVPTEVSIWPLAWGYWVVIGLALAALVYATLLLLKQRRWNKVKHQTLFKLQQIDTNTPYFEHKLQVLVKNLCAHYFANNTAIKNKTAHTSAWQAFLLDSYKGKNPDQLEQTLQQINASLYSNNTDKQTLSKSDLKNSIIDWLNTSIKRKYVLAHRLSSEDNLNV